MGTPIKSVIAHGDYGIRNVDIAISSEDTANNYGKEKLARFDPRSQWRTSDTGPHSLTIDLGAAQKVRAFYLGHHDFAARGLNFYVRAGSTSSTLDQEENIQMASGINHAFLISDITDPSVEFWEYRYFALRMNVTLPVSLGVFILFENIHEIDLGKEHFQMTPKGYINPNKFTGNVTTKKFSAPRTISFPVSATMDDSSIEKISISDNVIFWPTGTTPQALPMYFGTMEFASMNFMRQEETGNRPVTWNGSGRFISKDVTEAEKEKFERLSS